jgi:hypothetical protein
VRLATLSLFGLLAAGGVVSLDSPAPPLRNRPRVIDPDGWIVSWSDLTPGQIYELNLDRKAKGAAHGPVPLPRFDPAIHGTDEASDPRIALPSRPYRPQ